MCCLEEDLSPIQKGRIPLACVSRLYLSRDFFIVNNLGIFSYMKLGTISTVNNIINSAPFEFQIAYHSKISRGIHKMVCYCSVFLSCFGGLMTEMFVNIIYISRMQFWNNLSYCQWIMMSMRTLLFFFPCISKRTYTVRFACMCMCVFMKSCKVPHLLQIVQK